MTTYETPAETEHAHLRAGESITIDELAVHLSAIELRLRQLARAAETPETPVELSDTITALRNEAERIRDLGERTGFLARIVAGDVPLRRTFSSGDPWGAAALDTDREDFGGPAVIPTQRQLSLLAQEAARAAQYDRDEELTTYPEGMAGVPDTIRWSWESKEAQARRRREWTAAVAVEVLHIDCKSCHAGDGDQCRTSSGWVAEQPHAPRQRQAEANVSEGLGDPRDNSAAVPHA